MSRFLRQINDLHKRFTTACGEELRQTIIVSGGLPEADNHEPRICLIPFFRIVGGLPETEPYEVTDMPTEDEYVDAIA